MTESIPLIATQDLKFWPGPLFRDKFGDILVREGYLPVRHPRQNINPMDLLWRASASDFEVYGRLPSIFLADGNVNIPTMDKDKDAAAISGVKTDNVQIGVGLSILGNILRALGAGLGIEVEFKRASSITFKYESVQTDSILLSDLGNYLNASHINPNSSPFERDLIDRDELYAITTIAKCKKLTVETKDERGLDVKLNIPVISQLLGANIKVSPNNGLSSKITFEGNNSIAFGVKVARIIYDGNKFQAIAQKQEPKDPYIMKFAPDVKTESDEVVPGSTIPLSPIRLRGYE